MTIARPADQVPLQIHVTHQVKGVRIALVGELDIATAPQFRERLADLIASKPNRTIAIDMASTSYVDSTGLSILITAHKRLEHAGGNLFIENPPAGVVRLFEVSGLLSIFSIASAAGDR